MAVDKGHSKKRERHHDKNLPALATYLPTSPSTAKSRTQRRRGGRGGSPISRPFFFVLRTCADVRFSVQIPPKQPAGDLKVFRARAREPPPRAARTTATPPKCHKTAAFGCRWPQNRGVPIFFGNIFAGAGLSTYLSWFFLSFFECLLQSTTDIFRYIRYTSRTEDRSRLGNIVPERFPFGRFRKRRRYIQSECSCDGGALGFPRVS